MNEDKRDAFVISCIAWDEHSSVLLPAMLRIRETLNDNLNFYDYSDQLKGLVYVFLILKPNNTIHEEELYFVPETDEVYGQFEGIPHAAITGLTVEQIVPLLAQEYYTKLKKFKDLNSVLVLSALHKNVKKLFQSQGWLQTQSAA